MRSERRQKLVLAVSRTVLWVFLFACGCGGGGGDSGSAPVITNLAYSPSSAQRNEGGGTVLVAGTVDFTDPDGDVSDVTIVTYNATGQQLSSTTNPIPGIVGRTSGVVAVSVSVPTTVAGDYTFEVFLTDASNHPSNHLSGTFSIVGEGGDPGSLATSTGLSPSHLVERNGELFWSEAGEESIRSISLSGGSPAVLATKVGAVEGITLHGLDLFWLDAQSGSSSFGCAGDGVIRKLHRTSTSAISTVLLAEGDICVYATADIVADDTSVFWVESTAGPNTYVILRTPVSGGASTPVATTAVPIVAMTGDDANLYWMESMFPNTGSIRSVPKAGGSPVTIAGGFVSRAATFAVNGDSVLFTVANFPGTDNLVKVPLTGGAPTLVSTLNDPPIKIVADDAAVYWIGAAGVSSVTVDGGSPTVLAGTENTPLDLAIHSDNLVWTDTTGPAHGETGAVRTVSKTGGQATVLFQGGDAPRALAADAAGIYWTEGGPIGLIEGFGRIARVPAGGVAAETVVSGVSSDSPPIDVSDTHVYVADKFRIKKVPLAGGKTETVAKGSFSIKDVATDGTFVYWVEDPLSVVLKAPVDGGPATPLGTVPVGVSAGPAGPIRLEDGIVYWMTNYDAILSVPAAGGTSEVVASGLPFLSDFVVDGTNVYFSEHDTGRIRKMSLAGGQYSDLTWESPLWSPSILATDGQSLYWINQEHVGKVPVAGGTATTLVPSVASDPYVPGSIAVDDRSVFWTEPPVMEIRTAPK